MDREPRYDAKGHRITEADARRAADDLERGDLTVDETEVSYPRRGRGRPSLSGAHTHMHSPKIEARVPPTVKGRLTHVAKQQGRPAAEVVRDALEDYLADH